MNSSNVQDFYVPNGVRYVSEIPDFCLPSGQVIIDKGICGCGFTEYCIRPENMDNVILCSPRVALLENKVKQHPGEPNILYFQNKLLKENFEKNQKSLPKEQRAKSNQEVMNYMSDYVRNHILNCSTSGYPVRILCTYDSFHVILSAIGFDRIGQYKIVVDEFQSLFLDSYFKPDIEKDFFDTLKPLPNVIYLSATPMLEKHIRKLSGFGNIHYIRFIWPQDMITVATIQEKWVDDIYKEISGIINVYKNWPNERPSKEIPGVGIVTSEEVVFYVNSVSGICKIISDAELEPWEVNIICSDTPKNKKTLKKLKSPTGNKFTLGEIPLKGEPHKMFTFCTRTTYLGADFYSTSAISVVASDANINSLLIDIRLDLPQILGRQRLVENPWKNECIVFYKTYKEEDNDRDSGTLKMTANLTQSEFEEYMRVKKSNTMDLLGFYQNRPNSGKRSLLNSLFPVSKTGTDEIFQPGRVEYYLGVSYNGTLVFNPFLELAEERAWELTRLNYKNNISVIRSIASNPNTEVYSFMSEIDVKAQTVIDKVKSYRKFDDKLHVYCEIRKALDEKGTEGVLINRLQIYYKGTDLENLYSYFGLEGCQAYNFDVTELRKVLLIDSELDILKGRIYSVFVPGQRYLLKDIKENLRVIYGDLGLTISPKASELERFFNVKYCQILNKDTGKRDKGYIIISIKS